MKESFKGVVIDRFMGLNSGPESALQDGECPVLDNYLVTDEYKLEKVPGNAVLSAVNSPNDKHYVRDGASNVEMDDLISHYRHVSGRKAMLLRYGTKLALFDEGVSTEGGENVDWIRLAVPAAINFDSNDGYVSWQSYQKNVYLADRGKCVYYDFDLAAVVDLNAENLAYHISLGGTAATFTTIAFSDFAVHKNRLFAAVRADLPNIVAFTQPFKNKFYEVIGGVSKLQFVSVGGTDENTGDLGDQITRIIQVGDNVAVYKNNSIAVITGTGLLTYRPVTVTTKVGCSAPGSVQATRIGVIALHNPMSGIYLFNGSGAPTEISGAIRKEVELIKGLNTIASGVWKEKYYFLSYQDALKSGGENNTTLVLNLSNMKWSKLDFGFKSFTDWLSPETPRYTMIKDDIVAVFGVGAKDKAAKDFTGGTTITSRLRTKAFDGGSAQTKKRWKGIILSFRSTDKALAVDFDVDSRYKVRRMVKTGPSPLWDRVKWNNFRWADERLMTKEVPADSFAKGFRMSVEIENSGIGRDYIESIAPVFVPSNDSRGGKR